MCHAYLQCIAFRFLHYNGCMTIITSSHLALGTTKKASNLVEENMVTWGDWPSDAGKTWSLSLDVQDVHHPSVKTTRFPKPFYQHSPSHQISVASRSFPNFWYHCSHGNNSKHWLKPSEGASNQWLSASNGSTLEEIGSNGFWCFMRGFQGWLHHPGTATETWGSPHSLIVFLHLPSPICEGLSWSVLGV